MTKPLGKTEKDLLLKGLHGWMVNDRRAQFHTCTAHGRGVRRGGVGWRESAAAASLVRRGYAVCLGHDDSRETVRGWSTIYHESHFELTEGGLAKARELAGE